MNTRTSSGGNATLRERPLSNSPQIAESTQPSTPEDTDAVEPKEGIAWVRSIPFLALHLACLAVFFVGWNWIAVSLAILLFVIRTFGITGFYHRYFSHKAFKTSRLFQFVGACLGNAAVQKGPIWWAAHHRAHHQHSDDEHDAHSPRQSGFWWSHMGWFMSYQHHATRERYVPDWLKFPELRLINKLDWLVPAILAVSLLVTGEILRYFWPALGVSGWQFLVWGFFVSTVALYHSTFTVNSLAHQIGWKSYKTKDDSRNNPVIAILTMGEGWHNNHHHYQASARQGFRWWEIDMTYYILVVLSWFGIVWDLKPVPKHVVAQKGK